jgi:hypothetical protein
MAERQTYQIILFSSCTSHMSCVQGVYQISVMPTIFCFMDPNYKCFISRNQVYNLYNNQLIMIDRFFKLYAYKCKMLGPLFSEPTLWFDLIM